MYTHDNGIYLDSRVFMVLSVHYSQRSAVIKDTTKHNQNVENWRPSYIYSQNGYSCANG